MESFKFSHAMLTVLCNFPHKTAKGKTTLMIDPHDAKTKTYSKRKLAKGDFWGLFPIAIYRLYVKYMTDGNI